MSLVERLRDAYGNLTPGAIERADLDGVAFTVSEAADRIEALEAESLNDRDESLWRFWNGKARELAERNATLEAELSKAREALDAIRRLSSLDNEISDASAIIMSRMADIHQHSDAALCQEGPQR